MVAEQLIEKNVELIVTQTDFILHLSGGNLEECKNLCMNSWFPDRVFNPRPSEYVAEAAYKSLYVFFLFNSLIIYSNKPNIMVDL
jgi:hypothetical protein